MTGRTQKIHKGAKKNALKGFSGFRGAWPNVFSVPSLDISSLPMKSALNLVTCRGTGARSGHTLGKSRHPKTHAERTWT